MSLEQHRFDLAAAVAQARRDLRRARAASKARASVWQMSEMQQRAALIVFASTGYEMEPSVHYLERVGRRRGWPAAAEGALRALVEEWFLAVRVDDLAAMTDAVAPSDPAAMRDAAPVIEEWRLASWVRLQNVEKGVAPSTADLLLKVASCRLVHGQPEPQSRGTSANSASRKWASRFRLRWGGRYGALPVGEDLPLEEMLAKARRRFCVWRIYVQSAASVFATVRARPHQVCVSVCVCADARTCARARAFDRNNAYAFANVCLLTRMECSRSRVFVRLFACAVV